MKKQNKIKLVFVIFCQHKRLIILIFLFYNVISLIIVHLNNTLPPLIQKFILNILIMFYNDNFFMRESKKKQKQFFDRSIDLSDILNDFFVIFAVDFLVSFRFSIFFHNNLMLIYCMMLMMMATNNLNQIIKQKHPKRQKTILKYHHFY